ncbi:hypothetical protein P692DRAFT_20648125, partial [Suillus brevipes Sb2]
DDKICMCDTPLNILARTRVRILPKHVPFSPVTRPPAGHRKPPIHSIPTVRRPPPTSDSQQSAFRRFSSLLRFSPRTNAVRPGQKDQSRDPLDFPATSPLPSN